MRNRWLAALAVVYFMLAPTQVPARSPDHGIALGRDLFRGKVELTGKISTHVANLPPEVVRCSNCHAVGTGKNVARSLAPRLTAKLLLTTRPRRGGPASSYSRDSFCAVLRNGTDPAYVLISVQMPRYTVDEQQCDALWRFITGDASETQH